MLSAAGGPPTGYLLIAATGNFNSVVLMTRFFKTHIMDGFSTVQTRSR